MTERVSPPGRGELAWRFFALGQTAKVGFHGSRAAALAKAVKPAIIIQTSTYRKSGFDGSTAAAVKGPYAVFLREDQWNMQPDNN